MSSSFDPLGQIANALTGHSRHMQIISENLGGINSIGSKQIRPEFRSFVNEGVSSSGPRKVVPNIYGSGLNGITVESRQDILRQGPIAQSQKQLDLAIEGQGFFLVQNRVERAGGGLLDSISLTRNGQVDKIVVKEGGVEKTYLTLGADQNFLLGWVADSKGKISPSTAAASLDKIEISGRSSVYKAIKTIEMDVVFNLNANASPADKFAYEFEFIDNQGNNQLLSVVLQKVDTGIITPSASNKWVGTVSFPAGFSGGGSFELNFDSRGKLIDTVTDKIDLNYIDNQGEEGSIVFKYKDTTSFADATTTLISSRHNGVKEGIIDQLRFDPEGQLIVSFSNGKERVIAKVALGDVRAREQLITETDLKWRVSKDSGQLQIIDVKTDNRATFVPSSVEYGNMELSELLTDMILSQKIYGSLSKTLTVVDELIDTTIKIKS